MSLHFETTGLAKRRAFSQRMVAAIVGLVVAFMIMLAGGLAMEGVKLHAVAEYQPQFVMVTHEMETTCGGMISCPIGTPILRKPTAPASSVIPLGLAPHVPLDRSFVPDEDWYEKVPEIDDRDDVDFGGGCWSL